MFQVSLVVEEYNLMGPVKAALKGSVRYLAAELASLRGSASACMHCLPGRSRHALTQASIAATNSSTARTHTHTSIVW
jgi:enoyl-[acyl-carrier-protein] reductase (NADH)